MADEPERRFLPTEGFDPESIEIGRRHIVQDYLGRTGEWTIRVRRTLQDGAHIHHLTMKRTKSAVTNTEHEVVITADEYQDVLTSCETRVEKTRHLVEHAGRLWEIDVFHHPMADPRSIMEVELGHEGDNLVKPQWAGREVTGDRWYSNAAIAERLATMGDGND